MNITNPFSFLRLPILLLAALLLASCQNSGRKGSGLGEVLPWAQLPGWQADQHAQAWPALLKGCRKLQSEAEWTNVCTAATSMTDVDNITARAFFEAHFAPRQLFGDGGREQGLITGYYEPLLQGSYTPDARYRHPLYGVPDDLLIVDLSSLYPDLKGKRVRGRLEGNTVLPYYDRAQIDGEGQPLKGNELLWVDDRDAVFFLQIQGSGRIQLPTGEIIGAGYANQNGHPYVAIGKVLIERGEIERKDVSLFSIRKWLKEHPNKAQELLNQNPSFVFFTLREDVDEGPIGSMNLPITAGRSVAIDPKVVPLGTALWLSTTYPDANNAPLQRMVFAQDTGGAIKGQLRADLFWGAGEDAERRAGLMKQQGALYVLELKP